MISVGRGGFNRFVRLGRALLLAIPLAGTIAPAFAGVTPEVSRVIVHAKENETSVQLFNLNDYPVLVQAWVDDGAIDSVPQDAKAPIIALPPIFRMNRGEQTSLRLLNTGMPLPADRESLFWLNLYEIPATRANEAPDAQQVTVMMRTQLKVFVRPDGLREQADALPGRLEFSAHGTDRLRLDIYNPTPYHATFGKIHAKLAGADEALPVEMLAPLSRTSVVFDKLHGVPGDDVEIAFALIDDDGNPVGGERRLKLAAAGQ
ncbi:pili assembly chaperone [Burkholderia sp. SRS-W-2-2016]|nr:pili assembly chaperone [Burkholderia sp. SRS-W-2-2016]